MRRWRREEWGVVEGAGTTLAKKIIF